MKLGSVHKIAAAHLSEGRAPGNGYLDEPHHDPDVGYGRCIAAAKPELKVFRGGDALHVWPTEHSTEDPNGDDACPLHYDWQRKNTVGISTRDASVARQWIIEAMLPGYGVFRHFSKKSFGGGRGSIASIRAGMKEQNIK